MDLAPLLSWLTLLIFALWAYLVFALAMDQRRTAARRSGQSYAGLRDSAQAWVDLIRAPRHRGARWRLGLTTLALLLLLIARLAV